MNGDNTINNFPINDKPSKGPVLGTIIIVLIIIIGGIYIIASKRGDNAPVVPPTDETPIDGTVPTGSPTPDNAPVSSGPADVDSNQAALSGLASVESDLAASEADLKSLETEVE